MPHLLLQRILCIVCCFISLSSNALAQKTIDDFSQYYDQIYQIRVISQQAGSKSAIGSGFQVSADGLIVTNYHVVSSYIQSPDLYEIKYQSQTGEVGSLELLDFDVVNDLAVLQHSKPDPHYFSFSKVAMTKGEIVYALGNPQDYGITLVPGPNNGLVEHSYDDQILFSASLNSGMSGGPALNDTAQVVGVNVATAGSQLSFLVPVSKVITLVERRRKVTASEYQLEILNQIKTWQKPRLEELIESNWRVESFVNKPLFGEIRKDFQCWGSTNQEDKERVFSKAVKRCYTGNPIYLDHELDAGNVFFAFRHYKPLNLNSIQFSQITGTQMYADNQLNFEQVGNYQCHSDVIKAEFASDGYTRIVTCLRKYKKLTGLYDSMIRVEKNTNTEAFNAFLSISGAEKEQISLLNRTFVERVL